MRRQLRCRDALAALVEHDAGARPYGPRRLDARRLGTHRLLRRLAVARLAPFTAFSSRRISGGKRLANSAWAASAHAG